MSKTPSTEKILKVLEKVQTKGMEGQVINGMKLLYRTKIKGKGGNRKYLVECFCGRNFLAFVHSLTTKNKKSCGCKKIVKDAKDEEYCERDVTKGAMVTSDDRKGK